MNASSSGQKFEVLNFGVIGYNTAQEYARLRNRAIKFRPSLVVVYYVFNDPEIYTPISFARSNFLSRFYLYQFYEYTNQSLRTINEFRIKAGRIAPYLLSLHSSIYFEATKKLLVEAHDIAASRLQRRASK